jgi:nucleoside-diphosphate-sugar epimerase
MSALKVLFIGGTGIISSAVARRAVSVGVDLHIVTRGLSAHHSMPRGVTAISADVTDSEGLARSLAGREFDAVVNWVAFTPADVQRDIEFFENITAQYVFISSASAYQTPPARLPIVESTPLRNPFWAYSRAKIASEDLLMASYRDREFPVTIVRPSHTYDETMVPFDGGWTVMERMRQGREVVVPGDGTSLWTITHSADFARGFLGLLGRPEAVGNSYHITSDNALTWNHIYEAMARAAGVEPRLVHVPSAAVAAVDSEWGAALLGDKSHSMIFDNSKIKALVPEYQWQPHLPFEVGAEQIVRWHDADPGRRAIDTAIDRTMDELVEAYRPRTL